MIDFRSDTVTKPSAAMKEAMFSAEVEMMFLVRTQVLLHWKRMQQSYLVKRPDFSVLQELRPIKLRLMYMSNRVGKLFVTKKVTSINMKVEELQKTVVLPFVY
jgi:hypothetical protein